MDKLLDGDQNSAGQTGIARPRGRDGDAAILSPAQQVAAVARARKWPWIAGLLLSLTLLLRYWQWTALQLVLRGEGVVIAQGDTRDVVLTFVPGDAASVTLDLNANRSVHLKVGDYRIVVTKASGRKTAEPEKIAVTRGARIMITIRGPDAPPPTESGVTGTVESVTRPSLSSPTPPRPTLTNSVGMKFVLIPAGEVLMGASVSDSAADSDEKPQHRVRITKSFYLGVCEVTQAEYELVMGTNPSRFTGDPRCPVEQVSWNDAVAFCRKLSELPDEQAAGGVYRLPTEAEWEYACRAGTTTIWSFGNEDSALGEYAWYEDNSGNKTHPVGQKKPNAWGLYDMHGNAWEWCTDWYDWKYYASSPVDDPVGPAGGSRRVIRGGRWCGGASNCRAARRDGLDPGVRNYSLGFRLARAVSLRSPSR